MVIQDGIIQPMVIHSEELFGEEGPCKGADFAVGRLFLFEYEMIYNIDMIGVNSMFEFRKANQIQMDSNLPDPSTSKPSSSSNPRGSSLFSNLQWVIIGVFIALILIINVFVIALCRRRPYQDEDQKELFLNNTNDSSQDYAKIKV